MFCISFVYVLYMLCICFVYALYMLCIWLRYGGDMVWILAADNGRQREVRIREWLTVYGLLINVTRCNNFYFQRCYSLHSVLFPRCSSPFQGSQAYHAGHDQRSGRMISG